MLSLLVLLVAAVAVLLFGSGLTLSSTLIAAAVIVIVWSIGAFVPTRREPPSRLTHPQRSNKTSR